MTGDERTLRFWDPRWVRVKLYGEDGEERQIASYYTLRKVVGILGVALPLVLWVGVSWQTHNGYDGTRCTARAGLHIDHGAPFAIYRRNDERLLQLLCAQHNLRQAERVYGSDFMKRKIASRRRKAARTKADSGQSNR